MITVASFTPSALDPQKREGYLQMIPQKWAPLFDLPHSPSTLFIGLETDGEPQGLCICSLSKTFGYCDLAYFYLKPNIETVQNYTRLFNGCIEKARAAKMRYLTILYPLPAGDIKTPLIQTLESMGWQKRRLWSRRFNFDCRIFHPSWMHTPQKPTNQFHIFPWTELLQHERTQVKKHMEQYNLPDYLSPFYQEEFLQSANSVGLRDAKGRVVGWVITHTFSDEPKCVHYSCFYIHPEIQRLSISIQLLREAIKRQQTSNFPYSTFEVSIPDSDATWLKFINKRLAPEALKITDFARQIYIL